MRTANPARIALPTTIANAAAHLFMALPGTRVIFEGGYLTDGGFSSYDVTPDGKHFLMLR
jgi:hypothetical protein